MAARNSRRLGVRLRLGARMKGWNAKIIDRLPHHKRAGRVDAYPEIDLADPRAVHMAGCTVTLPKPILTDVKIPAPTVRPRCAGRGPRYEVWCGRVRLWSYQQPVYEAAMEEMVRLADETGYRVRNLRLRLEPCDVGSRVAVRSDPDAVAQLTARVRSQLLRQP